jgi:peptidoglycan/LPS O-acetylase OafA/YrhL
MISGFVIYMTLEKANKPIDFCISRFARLFPAYWFAICLTLFFLFILPNPPRTVTGHDILINFTMLQEYFGSGNIDGSYWTLSFELAFYASVFCLFFAGFNKHFELLCFGWLTFYFGILVAEHFGLKLPNALNILTLSHYDHLFIAGMTFYKMHSEGKTLKRHIIIGLCYLLELGVGVPIESDVIIGPFFILFYAFVYGKLTFLCLKPFVFLGTISYSLYLIHHQIGLRIMYLFKSPPLGFAVALVSVLVLATGMNIFIERPGQKLFKTFLNSRFNS